MMTGKKLVLFSLAVCLLLVVLSPVFGASNDCFSCHSSSSGSAGYGYVPPDVRVNMPTFVDVEEEFEIGVTISFMDYTLKDVEINLISEPDVLEMENNILTLASLADTSTFTFTGKVTLREILTITVKATMDVYYRHSSGSALDLYAEEIVISKTLNIASLSLVPSHWSLALESEGSIITLLAEKDITALDFIPPENARVLWSEKESLDAGESVNIKVIPTSEEKVDGNLIAFWEEEGIPYAMSIETYYLPTTESGEDMFLWTGRITGLLTIGLLVLSIILGGLWNTRKLLKKMIRARTRVKFHCVVSWFLLALSLYHGLVLLLEPYSKQIWNVWIILGYISALFMGVASLSGGLMKWMVKKIGFGKWKFIHLYSTFATLALAVLHGMKLGTDLDFMRNGPLGWIILSLVGVSMVVAGFMSRPKKKQGRERVDVEWDQK